MNLSSLLHRQIAGTSANDQDTNDQDTSDQESAGRRLRERYSPPAESLFSLLLFPVALVCAVERAPAQSVPTDRPETYVTEPRDPMGNSSRPAPAKMPTPRPSRSTWALPNGRMATPADSAASARKSPGRALAYSLGGTVLLAPLFGTGLVAGPAAGHFYAGNSGQAWTGIGIRSGALLTVGLGWGLVLGSALPTGFEDYPDGEYDPTPPFGDGAETAGVVLLSVGMAALLGSAAYDIATVWDVTREQNRTRGVQAQVAPAIGPRGDQVGLSLRLQF